MQACVYSYVATCKLIHVCNVCRYVAMYQGIATRGVPIWEFWVLPIPIIFLSKCTDTDH